jgi:hypothetical protein
MKKSVVIIASALLFVDCGPETDCAVELFALVIAIGLLDLARRLKDLHFYHEFAPKNRFFNEASCGVRVSMRASPCKKRPTISGWPIQGRENVISQAA